VGKIKKNIKENVIYKGIYHVAIEVQKQFEIGRLQLEHSHSVYQVTTYGNEISEAGRG
jgi:hypothetical protein